jgi:antirestriction protein ArdC
MAYHRTRAAASARPSPAATITQALIARLEAGTNPWRKPWTTPADLTRPLRACGQPYRGINAIYLWLIAEAHGYACPTWMTYNQASALGGQVRKGETSEIAVFFKSYEKTDRDDATGDDVTSRRRVMRAYHVFNVAQIDNLPERFTAVPTPAVLPPDKHQAQIDAFIAAQGADIRSGGSSAHYVPSDDYIQMPLWQDFASYALYGATATHELAHWTGHPDRLARDLQNRFGSADYAREELIAEMASAMVGADLGLPAAHLDNHAAYMASWLKLLREDDNAIFKAAAKAEEAAQYLLRNAGHVAAVNKAGPETADAAVSPDLSSQERIAA